MEINIQDIRTKEDKRKKGGSFELLADFLNKDIAFKKKGLSDKKKEAFFTELSILVSSGIDLKSSVEFYSETLKKQNEINIYAQILKELISGASFSETVRNSGKFHNYEYYCIRIGEETGLIQEVLEEIKVFYERKVKLRRQILSALSYPLIVLLTAILAVSFMLMYLVPLFSDVFMRFGKELPQLTQSIVGISNFIGGNILLFSIIIIGLVIINVLLKKTPAYRMFMSMIIIKTPALGALVKAIFLSRFCQSMSLLLKARVPLLQSLQMTRDMVGFYPIEEAIKKIEIELLEGKSLHVLISNFDVFGKKMAHLIKVGEEINKLPEIFTKLHSQYAAELDLQTKLLSSILEPLLILIVGLFVGLILVAMYLPMFELGTSMF